MAGSKKNIGTYLRLVFHDQPWLISFIFLIAGWLINGLYLGWIDDVMFANLLAGNYTPEPLIHPGDFIGISHLLVGLYAKFPLINWYGCFLFFFSLLGYFTGIKLIGVIIERSDFKFSYTKKVILFFTYSLIINEFLIRNISTTTSMLLIASGIFLLFFHKKKSQLWLSIASIFFGLLIRLETSIPIIIFILMLLLWSGYHFNDNIRKIAFLFSLMLSAVVLNVSLPNEDWRDFGEMNAYEFAIQDMYLYPPGKNPYKTENLFEDPDFGIKYEAVVKWNTYDPDVLTLDFYKSLYKDFDFNALFLWEQIVFKTRLFLHFSQRYKGASSVMNWHLKILVLSLLLLAWQLFIILRIRNLNTIGTMILFNLLVFGFIFMIAIVAKIEDRLVYPILLCALTGFIINFYSKEYFPNKTTTGLIILMPLLLFGIYRFFIGIKVSALLEKDLTEKRLFIDELNSKFSNTTFLLDSFTPFLFQNGIFKNVRLNDDNEFILGPNFVVRHYDSINNYFEKRCQSHNINDILNCFSNEPDAVIIAWNDNIDFLKRWNSEIYNDEFNFNPVLVNGTLSGINNIFLWNDLKYDYYTIAK